MSEQTKHLAKPAFPAIRTLFEATRLFLKVWSPVVVYGVAVEVLVVLALAPLFTWALAEMLSLAHSDVILNYDLASFAFSVPGIALGLLWSFLACTVAILAYGGGVVLIAAAHEDRTVPLRKVARRVLGTVHRILGLGGLKLTLWLFALVPLVGAAATAFTSLILAPFGAGPVEHWLPDEVRELAWVVPAMIALACLGYALFVRWSLTIHCFVLERLSLSRAIRRSTELVRGSFWPIARVLATHHLSAALGLGAVTVLLGFADDLALGVAAPEKGSLFRYLVALLIVLDALVLSLATIFFMARGVAILTLVYFRLQGGEVPLDLETDERTRTGAARRRALAVGLIVLALGAATALTVPEVTEELDALDTAVEVTAQRGSSVEAPENTLAAIELAIEDGADVVEIDVQEAKDGSIVVVHDESLKRVAGMDRKVFEMTLEELRAVDVGSWFDPKFKDERIPTLDEVLKVCSGRIDLNIELKVHGHERDFARAVLKAIRRTDSADECVIQSLDYPVLQEVRALDPDLYIGMIVSAKIGRVGKLDVDFYSVHSKHATVAFIREAHESGRDVYVWTVNEPAAMRRFIDRGVDSIITDHPRPMVAILEDRSGADELYAAIVRLFRR
ncbi:MAG: glycerophosphodiester phosphodiesterase [Planctomycetota bacterium]|nr:glycerophosphodiester phosphodiesterase [Planctomycetota bacterium]